MKYLILFILFAPLFLTPLQASAAGPKVDTMYASYVYNTSVIDSTQALSALNKPDNNFVKFGNAALLDLKFRNHAGTGFLPIKANSILWVWAQKDPSVDSSAGQVVFMNDENDLFQSSPVILGDGLNIITIPSNPNGDYSFIELSLAEPLDQGSTNHAKSFLIDAVALLQDTTPKVSVPAEQFFVNALSSYPNPFVSNTTIHFQLETEGDIQLVVIDALGRESDRENAGYLASGVHEIPLAIRTPGFYFVRLLINGQPAGNLLKINAR